MELIECKTCGSHSFTNNKCDYCGNVYQIEDGEKETMVIIDDYHEPVYMPDEEEEHFFTKGQAITFWFLVGITASLLYMLALLFAMPLTIIITLIVVFIITHRKRKNK